MDLSVYRRQFITDNDWKPAIKSYCWYLNTYIYALYHFLILRYIVFKSLFVFLQVLQTCPCICLLIRFDSIPVCFGCPPGGIPGSSWMNVGLSDQCMRSYVRTSKLINHPRPLNCTSRMEGTSLRSVLVQKCLRLSSITTSFWVGRMSYQSEKVAVEEASPFCGFLLFPTTWQTAP